MHPLNDHHWQLVKRILKYLKFTQNFALHLSAHSGAHLSAFSDADQAGDSADRRSIGAYCIYLGSFLVSWSSRKQDTIARSSTEAEYRSLAHATYELIHIQSVLSELGVSLHHPLLLWCVIILVQPTSLSIQSCIIASNISPLTIIVFGSVSTAKPCKQPLSLRRIILLTCSPSPYHHSVLHFFD